jgi:predicted ArsR family transcriptional regulator
MTHRMGMSQVKFKVRYNALLLREFTVDDMVRATGLNPESIRTELQRMKQEGLLTSQPHPDRPKRRGGPPALYRLTNDPKARLALSASIEAFYPPLPPADRPTSRHYLLVRQALDQAQTADDDVERKRLLSQAERDLEMAEQAEGGSLAPELIKAYLQYERARLAYLRDERFEAASNFQALCEFFSSIHDNSMVGHTREFLLCLEAKERHTVESSSGNARKALARCLIDVLDEERYRSDEAKYRTDSPLISLLIEQLRALSETAIESFVKDAVNQIIAASERGVEEAAERVTREAFASEKMYLTYSTAKLYQDELLLPVDRLPKGELRPIGFADQQLEDLVGRLPSRRDKGRKHA